MLFVSSAGAILVGNLFRPSIYLPYGQSTIPPKSYTLPRTHLNVCLSEAALLRITVQQWGGRRPDQAGRRGLGVYVLLIETTLTAPGMCWAAIVRAADIRW